MLAPSSAPRPTALVIGGGVIGSAIALRLAEGGWQPTIVDMAAESRGASWGNAGHIAVEQVEPLASRATVRALPRRLFARGGALALPWREAAAWLPFSLRLLRATQPRRFAHGQAALTMLLAHAMGAWRRLAAAAGVPGLLREEGHFIVWETPATAAAGRAHWLAAPTGTARVRAVTPAERARLEAITRTPIADAVHVAGSGQIDDPGDLADALARALAAAGGLRVQARVARLERDGGAVAARLDTGERIAADLVVVAAGARSAPLLRPLGHRVPLIAERGYHIQSAESAWPRDLPPVVFEDRSMIVTRFRGGLRAASFVEFARVDAEPDPRKWARLRAHVASLGLPFDLPGARWMGARPTLPDYLPAIGRSAHADNLLYAFGHQHLGLTLAATTAEAVAALAAGEPAPYDLAPFDLARFGA